MAVKQQALDTSLQVRRKKGQSRSGRGAFRNHAQHSRNSCRFVPKDTRSDGLPRRGVEKIAEAHNMSGDQGDRFSESKAGVYVLHIIAQQDLARHSRMLDVPRLTHLLL